MIKRFLCQVLQHRRCLPVAAAAALFAAVSGPSAIAGGPDVEALKTEARTAVKGLMQGLQKELKAALKDGGPVKAINVCKTVAPSIAEQQSATIEMQVGRTALKVRNPDNAPDAFETAVLEKFVADIEAGKDAKTLEHAEIIEVGDDKVFRYMKAIPTMEKPCLACHGETLAPEVKAEIEKAYPDDQATGFKAGDLRGAFTISKKL